MMPFELVFLYFVVALGWLVYRDAKEQERVRRGDEVIPLPGGNRYRGGRWF